MASGAEPRIATAGWAIPRSLADRFPAGGAGLARYAARFSAVEINSTFHRSHRASTYARWAALTPAHFRFAVKLPRAVTHVARLADPGPLLEAFRDEVRPLGARLGPLLIQLPPSLAFTPEVADGFFGTLRGLWSGTVVCEPRHPSWFGAEADALLVSHRIGRVAADPAPPSAAFTPGGWAGVGYWRLHGSPRMYRSPYGADALRSLAGEIRDRSDGETWCVFDNTASGAAAGDALALQQMLAAGEQREPRR